jgi:hypothetical protein
LGIISVGVWRFENGEVKRSLKFQRRGKLKKVEVEEEK